MNKCYLMEKFRLIIIEYSSIEYRSTDLFLPCERGVDDSQPPIGKSPEKEELDQNSNKININLPTCIFYLLYLLHNPTSSEEYHFFQILDYVYSYSD